MSNDLAAGGSRDIVEQDAVSNASTLLGQIIQASRDPSVDAGKMESMARLAIELQDRDLRAQFNRDKAAALFDMPAIYKRGKSDKHRYAKFEDLHRAVAPILRANNLILNFDLGSLPNGHIAVTPILAHRNGLNERGGTLTGPPDAGPGRSPIQAVGSSGSYLKRHAAKAILNLIEDGEDNDGAAMGENYQLNDRQIAISEEAEMAAESGNYEEWFEKLRPQDRGWMITTGRHAQHSGVPSLPGTNAARAEQHDRVAAKAKPVDPPKAERVSKYDVSTPEGWTSQYIEDCAACRSVDDLRRLTEKSKGAVGRLAELDDQKLWQRAQDAHMIAHDRITDDAGSE